MPVLPLSLLFKSVWINRSLKQEAMRDCVIGAGKRLLGDNMLVFGEKFFRTSVSMCAGGLILAGLVVNLVDVEGREASQKRVMAEVSEPAAPAEPLLAELSEAREPSASSLVTGVQSLVSGTVFKDCPECPEMVVLPKGSFDMGDLTGDGDSVEQPVHRVTINYALAVGRFEVTFDQWAACVRDNACTHSYKEDGETKSRDERGWGRGTKPVINVDWREVKQFTYWLSQKSGYRYRLLSEAEWEYAARAGTDTPYSFGWIVGHNQANCDGCGSQWDDKMTAPVGSFKPNPFGLYDMHGNVREWTEDCWNGSYNGAPADGSIWRTGDCKRRVIRGGCWRDDPSYLRSANRNGISSSYRVNGLGFRVARTVDRQ